MSSSRPKTDVFSALAKAKEIIRSQGLEEQFLKSTGIDSLDELDPKNFSELEAPPPPVVLKPTVPSAPMLQKPLPTTIAEASTGYKPTTASDMLRPYIGLHLTYASRKKLSSYRPSSLMMDYIVHLINDQLVDHFYFRRACPDYHPYILRLYYGVVFWIQCLRAGNNVRALDAEQHQFLTRFLDAYPPETLTISGPLLDLYKTLCASQPEIPTYGKVYPILPPAPGPATRDVFMLDDRFCYILPIIPGILALLENLNSKLNPTTPGTNPVFPNKGKHIPVPDNRNEAVVFAHHQFPATANMTQKDRWMLASSGLQYSCEADKRLHEGFAERYENFNFPATAATDDLRSLNGFMSMIDSLAWFAQVKEVAAIEAAYFEGSGTLADCASSGLTANQIVVEYQTPTVLPTPPTHSFDTRSLFPFSIRLRSSARSPPELTEAMAALAQTNAELFGTHLWLNPIGQVTRLGEFWAIRPIEKSIKDETSYLSLKGIIRGLVKQKT